MKQCTKCKRILPETDFYKNKRFKDGLQYWCKECKKEYYSEHIEERKKRKKEYHQKHKEERKYWVQKNRKRIQEWMKKYRLEHKEELKEYHKEYYQTEKGRKIISRSKSRRKRDLGFITFNIFGGAFIELENDNHHCNDSIVISIPKIIHENNYGENHREKVASYFSDNLGIEMFNELLG